MGRLILIVMRGILAKLLGGALREKLGRRGIAKLYAVVVCPALAILEVAALMWLLDNRLSELWFVPVLFMIMTAFIWLHAWAQIRR